MAAAMWRGLRGVCRLQWLLRANYMIANQAKVLDTGCVPVRSPVYSVQFGCRPLSTAEGESSHDSEEAEDNVEEKTVSLIEMVDVDTSMRYLESKAYKITYGDDAVWVPYRRNHKGYRPPEKTRKTCIRGGKMSTGNPCPICRDKYLVLHPKNVRLLEQFVSPQSGQVISYQKTGLCQMQHRNLLVAMHQAWDEGYIDKPITPREYDYAQYYPEYKSQLKELESLEADYK